MALPSYYISTSVTCVNTTTQSKILMLPPASTIPGVNLYIYDSGGAAATNPIYVSTPQGNEMDNGQSLITLNVKNQAFRITPYSNTKYAICANYTNGLTPFQYALRIITPYTASSLGFYDYTSSAISSNGQYVLVTGGGPNINSNAIYVSSNAGSNFTQKTSFNTSNSVGEQCCMSSSGQIMYVSLNIGVIYNSLDYGQNWNELAISGTGYTFQSMSCTADGSGVALIASSSVLYSSDGGKTFDTVLYPVIDYTYISVAVSGNGNILYVGSQNGPVKIGISNGQGGFDFTTGGGPSDVIWSKIVCIDAGFIAYATITSMDGDFLYKTDESGIGWQQLTGLDNVFNLVSCDTSNPQAGALVLVMGSSSQNVNLSTDGGTTFQEVLPTISNPSSLAISPSGMHYVVTETTGSPGGGRVLVGTIGIG